MNARRDPLRVLIADDHAPTRDDVRRVLDSDPRFEVVVLWSRKAEDRAPLGESVSG